MDNKKLAKYSAVIQTRDLNKLTEITGNVYEAIAIMGKRANQINAQTTEILREKLNEFSSSTDNLEEVHENLEQIEISKFYERMPKPPAISYNEFVNGETYYRKKDEEVNGGQQS